MIPCCTAKCVPAARSPDKGKERYLKMLSEETGAVTLHQITRKIRFGIPARHSFQHLQAGFEHGGELAKGAGP